jgi:hypothetical protein
MVHTYSGSQALSPNDDIASLHCHTVFSLSLKIYDYGMSNIANGHY